MGLVFKVLRRSGSLLVSALTEVYSHGVIYLDLREGEIKEVEWTGPEYKKIEVVVHTADGPKTQIWYLLSERFGSEKPTESSIFGEGVEVIRTFRERALLEGLPFDPTPTPFKLFSFAELPSAKTWMEKQNEEMEVWLAEASDDTEIILLEANNLDEDISQFWEEFRRGQRSLKRGVVKKPTPYGSLVSTSLKLIERVV